MGKGRALRPAFSIAEPGNTRIQPSAMAKPLVGIIMGSTSDWETMQHCTQTLDQLGVSYEKRVISAHRTPQLAFEWCGGASARGLKVIIAAAGGAAI